MPRATSPAELREQLAVFVETQASDLDLLDRSTLERWAECPWQAKAMEQGRSRIVGIAAEAGEAIHQALGKATLEWVQNGDNHDKSWEARDSIKTDLEFELRRSRPDLQPEVLKGMMPSVWAWSDFLCHINPGNILGFDGGDECDRSSQLAYDYSEFGVRVTSEIDLLYANKNTTELIEWVDYKTGHAKHDADEIADAFQFQMHAMLILHRFEDVKAARLQVWDTRINRRTFTVVFPRERLHDYEWRVRTAVETRMRHRDNPPTWPVQEKCNRCPVAALCPVADEPLLELSDEVTLVRKMAAIEARLDGLKKIAASYVDAFKRDIDAGNGLRFGRNKPPEKRKKPAVIYSTKGETNDADA